MSSSASAGAGGGPSVSAEELAAAEKEAAAAERALADAKARRAALSAELRDFDKAWPKIGTRISKLQMEVRSVEVSSFPC